MPLVACPSRNDLSGFNLGRLPEHSMEEIAAHLEQCTRCEETAKELDHEADPIVASLRGIAPLYDRSDVSAAPLPLPYRLGDYEILTELGRRVDGHRLPGAAYATATGSRSENAARRRVCT